MAKISRASMLAAAAALALRPRDIRAQTFEKIQFGGVPTDDMTPIYYAIKTGMYRKAGLDVEVVPTASGTVASTAILAGTYQMGKTSAIAAFIAHLKGLPLTVIANDALWNPKVLFTAAVVRADSTARTGADLNGKTGGTPALSDSNQLVISVWVDKNGGDSKTMKWIEIPNSLLGSAIEERRIDVCALQEPQLSAVLAAGKVRTLAPVYSAVADRFVFAFYVANKPWAEAHPQAVRRWVETTFAAGAYTNAHHAETVAMMADVTKIPADIITTMPRIEAATAATASPTLFQPLIDVAANYKFIEHGFSAKDLMFKG